MFAFAAGMQAAEEIGAAMQNAFRLSAGLESELFAGKVGADGARVL
jgi:hypothetical protein